MCKTDRAYPNENAGVEVDACAEVLGAPKEKGDEVAGCAGAVEAPKENGLLAAGAAGLPKLNLRPCLF